MSKEEIAKVEEAGALARPDFIEKGDTRGTEHIGKDDIQLPRIGLIQKMSPELDDTSPKYDARFKNGDMFNSLTKEIFGKGPLEFAVIRSDRPRGIEFHPREQGGGVKDFNVALDDPRMKFGKNGEKPVATKFYDYIIALLPLNPDNPMATVVALSMKSSQLKIARHLNTLIKLRNAPTFAGKYTLSAVPETNSKGSFYNFSITNAGWVDKPTYEALGMAFESIKDRTVDIDRDAGQDEPDPWDDGSATSGGATPGM